MYWLRKLLAMLLTLLLVSMLTFSVLYLIPGDPALLILGTEAEAQDLALVRAQLGLDRPLITQYGNWLTGIFRGDFGNSITFSRGRSIAKLVTAALPVTIPLALAAVTISILLAIPLGALAAHRKGSRLDSLILFLSQTGLSIPAFWLGILAIQFFAVELGWFPPGGMPKWAVDPFGAAASLLLPALVLAAPRAAILTRIVRSAMLEALGEEYIRTARGKGLSEWVVVGKHAFKNALVSISTVAGIQLIQLLAGAIVIEQVFALPGLGRLILSSVLMRDLPLVQGAIFAGAALILVVNFLLDSAFPLFDPRIREVV